MGQHTCHNTRLMLSFNYWRNRTMNINSNYQDTCTVHIYTPQYNYPNMIHPLIPPKETLTDIIKSLPEYDDHYISNATPKYLIKKRKDISNAFNTALPLSSLNSGDIIIIYRLSDIATSPRDAVKKIERYSSKVTIYIFEFNRHIPYAQYREELLAFFNLTQEQCLKCSIPPAPKDIPADINQIIAAYREHESTKTSLRKLELKYGITKSRLSRMFTELRHGEYNEYL